jgi:hypothetical protein
MANIDPVRRAPLGEKAPKPLSDRDLVQQLGPGRNLNIWIGTWNLGLSTGKDYESAFYLKINKMSIWCNFKTF